jgi:hypothetical protein
MLIARQQRFLTSHPAKRVSSSLQVQLWQIGKLMSPRLNRHLESCGVVPMLFASSWLMTAFAADFPVSFSARIMDAMLTDRCHCPLLKVRDGVGVSRMRGGRGEEGSEAGPSKEVWL